MNNFKKIFFLIFLIGLIIAPQAVKAAAADASILEYGPQTVKNKAGDRIDVVVKTTGEPTVIAGVPQTTVGTWNPFTFVYNNGEIYYFKGSFTVTADGTTSITLKVDIDEVDQTLPAITRAANHTAVGLVGVSCGGDDNKCAILKLDGADAGLTCERNICVALPENRAIGTKCDHNQHDAECDTPAGGFDFTCGKNDHCVGSTANIACMNDSPTVNRYLLLGKVYAQMDSSDRCDIGLYCDPNKGSCQNDFGQGKIPSDKLGEAAEDIRDQIRNIINIALGFLGVAGVIVTIYGGALWMSAVGDDEKVGKAKKTIVAGMIGLVIIGVAWTIVSYVLTITQSIS